MLFPRPASSRRAAIVLASAGLAFAGCGSGDTSDPPSSSATTEQEESAAEPASDEVALSAWVSEANELCETAIEELDELLPAWEGGKFIEPGSAEEAEWEAFQAQSAALEPQVQEILDQRDAAIIDLGAPGGDASLPEDLVLALEYRDDADLTDEQDATIVRLQEYGLNECVGAPVEEKFEDVGDAIEGS